MSHADPVPSSTVPLFLVDDVPAGARYVLTGDEARHAATVRRLRVGERLTLADGAGSIAHCVVDAVHAGRQPELEVSVRDRVRVGQPALRVTIVQALFKGDRGDLAVELATEAGADAIIPWRAARCVARWDDGPRGAKALARWRASARAATKQARRAWIPDIRDPVSTVTLAELIGGTAATLVLDAAAEHPITAAQLPVEGDLFVVVGPEGGISADELATLTAAGAHTTRLGPSVLRTSTAGVVALGAIGALSDRWSRVVSAEAG